MNILTLLSAKEFVSGQDIAKTLGVSRAAVHKRIKYLMKNGYAIISKKKVGYSLRNTPDTVIPESLRAKLANPPAVKKIIYKRSTASTQLLAKQEAAKSPADWVLVIAETQSKSYGRLSRRWESPHGGLWFSLLVRPDIVPEKVPQITLAMSVSLCRVFAQKFGVRAAIKWPNDILLKDKKLAGIVTEMSAEVGKTNWVVIGVGINVNNRISKSIQKTAISFKSETGKTIDRAGLLAAIITDFHRTYITLCTKGFLEIKKEYDRYSYMIGKSIQIKQGNETISGIAQKVDNNGYLVIKTAHGLETIFSGDATVVK